MSSVIKASGPVRAVDGVPFNFADMGDRAKSYLDQVRNQAAEILAQAHQDATAIRAQAEEQGRAAALEAATQILDEKVGRQMASLLPALSQAIDGIHQARSAWLAHWEKMAVHVSAAIAERVIRREVARQPEITLTLVKEALELAAGSAEIHLHMHPDDVAALGTQVDALAAEVCRLGKPTVVADAAISPGGCRIDTRFGSIDQQFAAQLARIEQELR